MGCFYVKDEPMNRVNDHVHMLWIHINFWIGYNLINTKLI